MYSTCIFCHAPLGKNESLESFSVGRRLAYDAAKGRLWVVCRKCDRWNLSPLEERWEAIEQAERAYRDTRKRVATDNVGLARLRDGTDLIRIGAPLRPEFAAWRYGTQFGKRHRKKLIYGASGVVAGAALIGGAISVSTSLFMATMMAYNYANGAHAFWQLAGRKWKRVMVTANDGIPISIGRADLRSVIVSSGDPNAEGPWSSPSVYFMRSGKERIHPKRTVTNPDGTKWSFDDKSEHIHGSAALHSLARILAATNRLSGAPRDVQRAVSTIEDASSETELWRAISAQVQKPFWPWYSNLPTKQAFPLSYLPPAARLALEMSLHEDDERRAMEGELSALEARWKEAEEIAAIADSLTLPANTDERLESLRKPSSPSPSEAPRND